MFPRRALDVLWSGLLTAYILGGMMLASFHGDEAMQIYMSHDYVTAFIERQPARLMVSPPYFIDDDPWLRILNGSVNRYAIGLSWHLAGFKVSDLPPKPGWDWGQTYEANAATGHRPTEALLAASRLSSTLFLAASAWVMFAIGEIIGGRQLAYLTSGLYALHPVILLNGRRAMQEGSFLLFGLLTVWTALWIVHRRTDSRDPWYAWLALAMSSALALASKHPAAILVAGAFGWIILSDLLAGPLTARLRRLPSLLLPMTLTALLAGLLWLALSPALWSDPPARLADLISERQRLLDIQVSLNGGPTSLLQRVEGLLTQPFLSPAEHFEVSFWAGVKPIADEIARYMESPLSGLQFGPFLGFILTAAAGIGLLSLLRDSRRWLWGLLAWLAVTVVSLLVNPLPWQRYSLPLLPLTTLLACLGLLATYRWLRRRFSRS